MHVRIAFVARDPHSDRLVYLLKRTNPTAAAVPNSKVRQTLFHGMSSDTKPRSKTLAQAPCISSLLPHIPPDARIGLAALGPLKTVLAAFDFHRDPKKKRAFWSVSRWKPKGSHPFWVHFETIRRNAIPMREIASPICEVWGGARGVLHFGRIRLLRCSHAHTYTRALTNASLGWYVSCQCKASQRSPSRCSLICHPCRGGKV